MKKEIDNQIVIRMYSIHGNFTIENHQRNHMVKYFCYFSNGQYVLLSETREINSSRPNNDSRILFYSLVLILKHRLQKFFEILSIFVHWLNEPSGVQFVSVIENSNRITWLEMEHAGIGA